MTNAPTRDQGHASSPVSRAVSSASAAASRRSTSTTARSSGAAYSTGPDNEVLITGDANANYPSHKGKDLGVSTWQGDEWKRGGGTTWGWYSYDPELNLFYYSTVTRAAGTPTSVLATTSGR